jgi:hypothetical protein
MGKRWTWNQEAVKDKSNQKRHVIYSSNASAFPTHTCAHIIHYHTKHFGETRCSTYKFVYDVRNIHNPRVKFCEIKRN